MEAQLIADEVSNALQLAGTFFSIGALAGVGLKWLIDSALDAAELGLEARIEARRKAAALTVTEFG